MLSAKISVQQHIRKQSLGHFEILDWEIRGFWNWGLGNWEIAFSVSEFKNL